jgi:CubicO group peptidase (beta-lactamase class C family)
MQLSLTFFILMLCSSCNILDSIKGTSTEVSETVTCGSVESQMTAMLDSVNADDNLPYTLMLERLSDGRKYSYSKSGSTPSTSYESASTSKMISGVIIMKAIENGYLTLTTKPQDKITAWPLTSASPLYNMTLAHLLSFTSSLVTEPNCIDLGSSNFSTCVLSIATSNNTSSIVPGSEFYYDSSHLQVAGQMVIKAKSMTAWSDVFSEFKTQTGLFPTATYDLPSSSNPRLAGGMHWSATEYMSFLRMLAKGQLLNTTSMTTYLQDRTIEPSVTMTYSPVKSNTAVNEDWHYGMGYWHECQSSTWNCTAATRISSPGAYGSYPFWDRQNNYFGIVARQGSLGTYPYGLKIERTIRDLSIDWSTCQ